MQAHMDSMGNQTAASAAAANQLQALLAEERSRHAQLQERMATAERQRREGLRERGHILHHLAEMEVGGRSSVVP
jgi:hypothetical protein